MKRLLLLTALVFLLLASSASAITVSGSDVQHRLDVYRTLCSQVDLLEFVEDAYPALECRVNYGGLAMGSRFDVNLGLSGLAFTEMVGHEFGHEVNLAADAMGLDMSGKWLDLLRSRGYGDETWVWELEPVYMGRACPTQALAENIRRAFYAPFSVRQYPNTVLVWLSPAEVRAFLVECGVLLD